MSPERGKAFDAAFAVAPHCAELETRLADVKQANRMANDLLEQALAELKAMKQERNS